MRRRYLAIKFNPNYISSKKQFFKKLTTNLALTLKYAAYQNLNIRIIEFDSDTGFCIVRTDHRDVTALREAIKIFDGVNLKSIKTSGSIKTLKQKLLTYEL